MGQKVGSRMGWKTGHYGLGCYDNSFPREMQAFFYILYKKGNVLSPL